MWTVKQMAQALMLTETQVYKRCQTLGIKPLIKNGRALYYDEQMQMLCDKVLAHMYPLKTTETFYIYESKINYDVCT